MTSWRRFATVLTLLNVPIAARGQGSRWERQVDTRLTQARTTLVHNGYAPLSSSWTGALDNGDTAAIALNLAAGSAYALVGVCDDDCSNLDLQLFAANRYEVDAAKGTGATPIVRVTPAGAGGYRLTVRMSGCGRNPCWYGVSIYRREGRER